MNTSRTLMPPMAMRGAHSQMRLSICHFKKSKRPQIRTPRPSTRSTALSRCSVYLLQQTEQLIPGSPREEFRL